MLNLPATPAQVLAQVILPTFQHLLPGKFDSSEARVLVLAIMIQESGLRTRKQDGGPAHGFPQFEQAGVQAVLANSASRAYARGACGVQAVAPIASDVYWAMLTDDLLGCAFARLMLWCDTTPLPAVGDSTTAWAYYKRNWRPGAPRPDDWTNNYAEALSAVSMQ